MAIVDGDRTATVRPGDLAEARAAMLDADAGGRPLRIVGAGTKQAWGAPVEAPLVIETGGMDRLIAHNAGDMTAEVEAGMPLARLNELLGAAGQWLALDPPAARGGPAATVGGIVAAGDAGPRRRRYGAPRDLVIGMTFVLSDGTIGRTGGHVIKNVAGYDLAKLLAGSLGTLGLITSLVVRLHPRPAASGTVRLAATAKQAAQVTLALMASPLEPTAVEWDGATLLVRLEGGAAGVKDRAGRVLTLAAEHGLDAAGRVLAGAAERGAWTTLAARVMGADGDTVARAATRPDRLEEVADALDRASQAAGVAASLVSSSALGLHTCRVRGGDPAGHAELVRSWRRSVEALGGTVRLRRRAAGVDGLVDAWGAPPSAVALMRRVKRALDPGGRCGPGRFAPWW
jgi:glycolate dehydrogenase FAD-binding subunit